MNIGKDQEISSQTPPAVLQRTRERLDAFDIAKAVALLAVVVGHCSFMGLPPVLARASYSFSMPLFFVVSGYFTPAGRLHRAGVLRSVKKLLIPYAITAVLVIVGMAARTALFQDGSVLEAIRYWTVAALYGSGAAPDSMPADIGAIGAIWFLWALFWARIVLSAISELEYPGVYAVALFFVGVVSKEQIWLPLSIQPALCAVLFLWFGQYIRRSALLEPRRLSVVLFVLMFGIWLYCIKFAGGLYIVECTFTQGPLDVIGGFCASLCILKMAQLAEKYFPYGAKLCAASGRMSLPLFCMHLVVLNVTRWDVFIDFMGGATPKAALGAFIVNIVGAAVLTGLLYLMPKRISGAFFEARKQSVSVS
ncbi:acyltransferase [Collinsella sp. AGMB00827]|uniref:Acyltransferase n=1 Tax=Collinsella ureilytica TaxID=2869515 RepID=A0ABS7MIA8_9ACTN|nr:acyltransferase [Collinsella urealyticum]MBY4796987.1 acyltransferase [Collinsella urealyticum]